MKILLVDDSPSARDVVAAYVQEMGYHALQAEHAAAAMALYRRDRPDLVLTDVEMPGMDGYQLAREIRRYDRGEDYWVPIIFLSGRVADEDIARGLDAGGDDYIAKPVSQVVLSAKLKAMRRITLMRDKLVTMGRDLRLANRELLKLSSQDGLTGIANRRSFDAALEREWRRSQLSGDPVALLMCDIDYFKRYNDGYGHDQGDICLKRVATTLAETVRACTRTPGTMVARYGGEEFVTLLPQTPLDEARSIADRLVDSVRALELPHRYSDAGPCITLSVGIAAAVPGDSCGYEHLLQGADQALYQSKADGRNRVSVMAA